MTRNELLLSMGFIRFGVTIPTTPLPHSMATPLGRWLGLRTGRNVVQGITCLEHRLEQRLICWMSFLAKQKGRVYCQGAHL